MTENSQLLAPQRRALILERVRQYGGVRVNELTREFGVSDMTIRRDLDALAGQGLVDKVHGGAVSAEETRILEPGFEAKLAWELAAKEAIAAAAAELVRPGAVVALGAGTTTYAVAKALVKVERLTIVTNSIRIAEVFEQVGDHQRIPPTVMLTGGIRTPSDALVGPLADQAIRALHVDILFLGCHGLTAEAGLTSPNLGEAATNRAFVRSAAQVVAVVDHTKWNVVGLSTFATLDEVDCLITDRAVPESEAAAERVGRVVVAEGTRRAP
ncbi:DeoR/GlpR family DNA-binding transcription regulator [Kitasatospora herbaricolor]|uniref:DeoR/GlpR family DNA-binding transcription regulator n=1 Tax=Kitasatospora herbaricolor TaxID=68217 RepID=A0ABZ1W1B5_9ACTN|nr:DeoR/GlpR family DNA-binding transcription regulator [Kitasatospora herbaricolor]